MSAIDDIAIIDQQETLLRFPEFDADTAWKLGSLLHTSLKKLEVAGTAEIELAGQLLFTCTTPGATPGHADWVRRKRNTVRRFLRSSYAIGRMLLRDGETLEGRHGLTLADYAAHGGGFPLIVEGAGCIGSVVVSGLPQRDDHSLVVAAIAGILAVEVPHLGEPD